MGGRDLTRRCLRYELRTVRASVSDMVCHSFKKRRGCAHLNSRIIDILLQIRILQLLAEHHVRHRPIPTNDRRLDPYTPRRRDRHVQILPHETPRRRRVREILYFVDRYVSCRRGGGRIELDL